MVCIFNFFVVPSCFTSSPNSLFPPWYFFGGLHPHPSRELAVAGCFQDKGKHLSICRESTVVVLDGVSDLLWNVLLNRKHCWKSVRGTLQGDIGYLTQAASQNWWWCQWYAVLYGKAFVAVCRLLYLQMVADSKRGGNYHLGSATLLAFRYVVWSDVRCSLMHFEWCICTGKLNSYLSFLSILISAAKVGIWSYFSVICLALKASFPISYLPLTGTSSTTTYTGSCFHLTCFSYFIFLICILLIPM